MKILLLALVGGLIKTFPDTAPPAKYGPPPPPSNSTTANAINYNSYLKVN